VVRYQGSKPAPLVFYWHGTGSSNIEVTTFFGSETQEIVSEGGLVAAFHQTTMSGSGFVSGDDVWYEGDFTIDDQVLACAVQQLNIDTSRIISTGCSAGGLMTGSMVYYRSSYLACAMPNSGGGSGLPEMWQDSHVPSLITTHAAKGSDVVVTDFSQTSLAEDMAVKAAAPKSMPPGGYVVDCNHGGGHCGAPANDIAAQWQFCKDHPFGVSPDPYHAMLPSSFPSYCTYQ
jgi:poly(3-hydroxybutyrate) depolymerase